MGSPHGHHHRGGSNERRLLEVLTLTGGFMAVEAAGTRLTGSLALLSYAANMLTAVAGLPGARISRRPAHRKRTNGHYRFKVLAAALNFVLLILIGVYILNEAALPFRDPSEVQTLNMFLVTLGGLAVNAVPMRLLAGGSASSMELKGACLEVRSDMLGSVAILLGAVAIWFTGWHLADPLLGVAVVLCVLARERRLEEALAGMHARRFGITHGAMRPELARASGGRDPHEAWQAPVHRHAYH